MPRVLAALVLLASSLAFAQSAPAPLPRIPSDAECAKLGAPKKPYAFSTGETLEFDLDAMGASAGKLTLKVLPTRDNQIPIEVTAHTNTFFSKVRRVTATATSYLQRNTLRPNRYVEDAVENEVPKYADVTFQQNAHRARLDWKSGQNKGQRNLRFGHDGFDPAGAIYLLRQLPMKAGMPVCFDAYGIRGIWRVSGKVIGKEHVSLKIGEFDAWHLQGDAVRLDNPRWHREIHLWISDDARRLPLAALGAMDLGVVRATLTGFSGPEGSKKAQGKESLKW